MGSSTGTPELPVAAARHRGYPAKVPAAGETHLTQTGFDQWVTRAMAIACLGTILPAVGLAHDELASLHPGWLVVLGGGLLGITIVMPWYAWSRRGVRGPAAAYAAFVLLGLLTWPLAWTSPDPALTPPWLWICVGLAILGVAVALSEWAAVGYAVVVAVVLFLVRMTPSGGAAPPQLAVQDTLWAVVQPAALLLVLRYLRDAVAALDGSLAASRAVQSDAALDEALAAGRARLDAIVHDEVMTTLVAAAHSRTSSDPHVAGQARHALDSLATAELSAESDRPVPGAQLARLVRDVVGSAAPLAGVTATTSPGLEVPYRVASALSQAVREAALNASRHSRAGRVDVDLSVTASTGLVSVRLTVRDDGVGFDPDHVPPGRLGLRVSVAERMRLVGGRAEVRSVPGEGTSVTLAWSGRRTPDAARPATRSLAQHPLLQRLDARPMRTLAVLVLGLHLVLGATSASQTARPGLVGVALVLAAAAAVLGLSGGRWQISPGRGFLLVAATWVLGLLCLGAMPPGSWPGHSTWFAGAGTVLLVLVAVRSREWLAWLGAVAQAVLVVGASALTGAGTAPQALSVALLPLAWLTLLGFLLRWLESLAAQLVTAEESSGEAAALRAELYSKLVLREVWLTDLRAEVLPLLARLAEPDHVLDDDLRASCLVVEASLRDAMRGSNLRSPGLTAAIVDARRRGVAVTLVDNRGDRLPHPVLRATLAELEALVRATSAGRIIARTAPAGYDAAVTIVSTGPAGDTRLTTIDETGAAAVSNP